MSHPHRENGLILNPYLVREELRGDESRALKSCPASGSG